MKYPERERDQIVSSIFRNSRRQDMFIQKDIVHEHFQVNSKSVGLEVVLLKKLRMITSKKHGKISRIIFVICQYVFLIVFFCLLFFLIM